MSRDGLAQRLPRLWFRKHLSLLLLPLLPFSWLFRCIVTFRRFLFRYGFLRSFSLPVPVIVVGNLTVGGSGKTPLVLWLVERLRERGWRPGVISRGYGGSAQRILAVTPEADAAAVGDEPLLLARRSGVPVFVGRDRVAAGKALLAAHPECDVVVSDDGLQHYRLARAAEVVVFDGRGAGNGQLLPAGPLREPLRRLAQATALVLNGDAGDPAGQGTGVPRFRMRLAGQRFEDVNDRQRTCTVAELRGRALHAVAGIGDPSRFFAQLAAMGLEFSAHPFPDHHVYRVEDFPFADAGVLLMTEKDAVKCCGLTLPEAWVLPVDACLDNAPDGRPLLDTILEKLNGRTPA